MIYAIIIGILATLCDVYIIYVKKSDNTLSRQINTLGRTYTLIPMIAGGIIVYTFPISPVATVALTALFIHFFWPF